MKWLNFDKCHQLKKSSKPIYIFRCYLQRVIFSLLELPILSNVHNSKDFVGGRCGVYSRRASVLMLGRKTLSSIATFTLSISVSINTSVKHQMCSHQASALTLLDPSDAWYDSLSRMVISITVLEFISNLSLEWTKVELDLST